MNYTIVGFFNKKDEAQEALRKLNNDGFDKNQVDLSPYKTQGDYKDTDYDYDEEENTSGFWDWLFGDDDDDRERHSRVGARTNVVTVYAADEKHAKAAASILDSCGALDVDDYDRKMKDTTRQNSRRNETGSHNDDTIDVVKEELNVGKRTVDTGGVRIKSRIVEKPVKEDIRLRDERVYVTRKPVNKDVSDKDAFQEKTIAMTEHAEKAVVEKNARVVEEIEVNKDVKQHEKTISDTVRETKVDVDKDFKK
ncbi:uncharacterized protein (TIGR02271 family) [Gelidibacter algens]|jgi:uncharacterized protein (TIGR02271 family)|uniref:Uncharacterized protein (TIGR02271 family) n=1 Tax=Gelidibacter algens TaxID=49280 RepID=A0A1A7R2G3_9FLAO|nr:YsnF/AvaK domain-containing protein [Gelidibacter algens]OBX26021.1 hypothetical protein A9996_06825 [Gelidibacter algens]RAJ27712.1 uncharacterized protein (TIGR02271 family) [Gelidibacter algens]